MKNLNKIAILALMCALIAFVSCRKELVMPNSKTQVISNSPSNDVMVQVPGKGLVPASQVHLIPLGHYLLKQNGHIYEMEKNTRKMIKDFGEIDPPQKNSSSNTSLQRNDAHLANNDLASIPGQANWIIYSQWTNTNQSSPISTFNANWKVPNPPFNQTGSQVIYLFNNLANSTHADILQPVLQWGVTAAGGGNYWAIANWYISNSFYAVQQPLLNVYAGTTISGVIKNTGIQAGTNSYNYISYFTGYNDTLKVVEGDTINKKVFPATVIPFVPQLTVANITLEAYGQNGINPPTSANDYPVDSLVKFTSVSLLQSSSYPTFNSGNLTTINDVTGTQYDLGQKTVIASYNNPNGEVDIYFHKPVPVITYTTPDVYTVGTAITPLTPTNTGGIATSYSVSPALPTGLTLNTTTGVISGTPTSPSASAKYTITATNSVGSNTTALYITINSQNVSIVFDAASTNTNSTSFSTYVDGVNVSGPRTVSKSNPITISCSPLADGNATVVLQVSSGYMPVSASIVSFWGPVSGVISGNTITFSHCNLSQTQLSIEITLN